MKRCTVEHLRFTR